MRRAALLVCFICLAAGDVDAQTPPSTAAVPQNTAPLTLADLEQLALANNPTMRQAQAVVEAARGRSRQAGAWPNPTVGYSGEEIAPGETIRYGEHGIFVEQTILLGGKLRLNRAVFDREVMEAEAFVELQRQRVLSSVRRLFYDALTADRRVGVNERLTQLASEAITVSFQLFNVGAADRPDVLESDIEARRIQLELNAAKNHQFAVYRQLAAAVGDRTVATRRLAGDIDSAIPELERDNTLRSVLENNPQVRAVRARLDRARAVTDSARRETFPDLFLRGGAAYNRELLEGTTSGRPQPVGWEANVEVGVSLPVFDRNAGGIAAARAEESEAEAELGRLQLALESQMAGVFDRYLSALRGVEVYRDEITPRAEEAYRLYLARYREMAAAYPQVLIAQRTLFEMSAAYLDQIEEAWDAALDLQGFLAGDALESPGRSGERAERPIVRTASGEDR